MKISQNNLIIVNLVILVIILLGYLVLSERNNNFTKINCPDTLSLKYECWRQVLGETLEKKGLSRSFDVLALLYDTEPDFVSECHSFTHELGEKAYILFSKRKDIEMTPKASYCGYGFYHGFMETLLHSGAGIKEAQEFCAFADEKLATYGTKVGLACYHGIGHGAVDGSDSRFWGSSQKLIEPGLSLCKIVSELPSQIHHCGTGVFNALAIALNSNLYNLNSSDEPYKICLTQESIFKKACYEQMNSRAVFLSNVDFDIAAKFVIAIPDKQYSVVAMDQLAPAMIANKVGQNDSFTKEVQTCRSLPEYLKMTCIKGILGGILEFGKPDYEYMEAMGFCDSLNQLEQEGCYDRFGSSLKIVYSREKSKEICNMFDIKYRGYCER